MSPLFDLRDVGLTIDERRILDAITLTVHSASVVGLIGQNGSGKSSLLHLLSRQQSPSTGCIAFDGRPVADWGHRSFAKRVAYLPQNPPADTGLLVEELVAFGRYPWHGPLGRFGTADRAAVAEAIALTDLSNFSQRALDTLSGGERQRAWLAMLLAQKAECLLLDEPISALDVGHQIEVLSLIRRLAGERKLGVVVVLHDVNLAARYCTEIVALGQGRIIASGPPDTIVDAAVLERIYGTQLDVVEVRGRRLAFAP